MFFLLLGLFRYVTPHTFPPGLHFITLVNFILVKTIQLMALPISHFYISFTTHSNSPLHTSSFYSYEDCFKGEMVLPGTVAKSSLKQEDLCNQRKQLYLPTRSYYFQFYEVLWWDCNALSHLLLFDDLLYLTHNLSRSAEALCFPFNFELFVVVEISGVLC